MRPKLAIESKLKTDGPQPGSPRPLRAALGFPSDYRSHGTRGLATLFFAVVPANLLTACEGCDTQLANGPEPTRA